MILICFIYCTKEGQAIEHKHNILATSFLVNSIPVTSLQSPHFIPQSILRFSNTVACSVDCQSSQRPASLRKLVRHQANKTAKKPLSGTHRPPVMRVNIALSLTAYHLCCSHSSLGSKVINRNLHAHFIIKSYRK